MSVELELPAAYVDALIEDVADVGFLPVLINRDPEPNERNLPGSTNITLDIASTDPSIGTIATAAVQVFVNGVLAYGSSSFHTGFTGTASNPQADVLRLVIDPSATFTSEELVSVRVIANTLGDLAILDTTYSFTIADTAPPVLIRAEAIDLMRVRVTFDESVMQTVVDDTASALDPANWTLDRFGDYLRPLVSASVVAVEKFDHSLATCDLITDIPLTPGGTYRATAINLEDLAGNAIEAPDNETEFVAWSPPQPAGRVWDLYRKIPAMNRAEDDTLDLKRFIGCLQEVADLLLYDIDLFIEILDPDTAPEQFVDAMLADLGNPFAFDLSLDDKRRLAQILVDIYRLKGTKPGIESVILFFLGLVVELDTFNDSGNTWVLGDSELGDTTILGTDVSALLYSFTVTVFSALTDVQRKQLRSIVEYMKPAHTHLVQLIEPVIPTILDHWELGLSELGENTFLH